MFNILLFLLFFFTPIQVPNQAQNGPVAHVLSTKSMSLSDRYPIPSVNEVFKDNILLTLAYMQGKVSSKDIDWKKVTLPSHFAVTLHKNEVFAFHDQVLSEFSGNKIKTTGANFTAQEGFVSDGYLFGDGVCHLASLISFAASSSGLSVVSPVAHDFAIIPDIPKKYGVAIYYSPYDTSTSELQNLYIKNTKPNDVQIVFDYKDNTLKVSFVEVKANKT